MIQATTTDNPYLYVGQLGYYAHWMDPTLADALQRPTLVTSFRGQEVTVVTLRSGQANIRIGRFQRNRNRGL